jgi:ubiquinone/menaquinone biosynthesis C-methylase UbiE
MAFSTKDISDYYNQTQNHYERWWNLKEVLAVHYGIWHEGTQDFSTALENTNREMAKLVGVISNDKILDAGCGVGGAAFFLSKNYKTKVSGITLSQKQLDLANKRAQSLRLENQVDFSLQSFSETNFKNESFDVIWACESSCYANPKTDFFNEAFRLLKPGGRIVIADYFLTPKGLQDKNQYIKKWGNLWAIDLFYNWADLSLALQETGLKLKSRSNYTDQITPSAKRMFKASKKGAFFSELYNLFNKTSRFAKHHYKSGIYQYKALQNQEWGYWVVVLEKPS